MTTLEKADLYEQLAKLERLKAKQSLLEFIRYFNPGYVYGLHHKILCDRFSQLPFQKRQRIMVFVPPQYGKSEIVSRHFPVWMLGHNPRTKIILASYSSHLADTFNRAAQKIILDPDYRDIFPARLSAKHRQRLKQTANYIECEWGGYLYSVGIGGSTTGRGADMLIIDDPIKDMADARSPTMRKRRKEWFDSVAQTRLTMDGHIILMHTRWSENDLAGEILAEAEKDPTATQWEVISLPAAGKPKDKYRHPLDKRKEGDPLWPAIKGNREELQKKRQDVGERTWASLYQQSPVIDGGNIIKETWFSYYTELPFAVKNLRSHNLIQSWDCTFKETGTSFVVGMVIARWEGDYWILDMWRKKADIVETIAGINEMKKKYPFTTVLVEDKANGPAIISLMKSKISNLVAIVPDASKDERLHLVAPEFEARKVHLPLNAIWTKDVVKELTTFPNGENDDIVDAVSQGISHFDELKGLRHLEASTKW